MNQMEEMLQKVLSTGQGAIACTIVHVDGSAYRKEGAWMFLLEDGTQLGMIGGGCLENDLRIRAQELFGTGTAMEVIYDLRAEDDLGWGRGIGCNGVITVLIRDVDKGFREALLNVHEEFQQGRPVHYIQELKEGYPFVFETTKTIGKMPLRPFVCAAGSMSDEKGRRYEQWLWPRPNLYLIGGGSDARPLASMAQTVGYAVHLLDWREALCHEGFFPNAASIQIGNVEQMVKDTRFTPYDSVVIMTHHFTLDQALLQFFAKQELLYLGLLGSKQRTSRLTKGISLTHLQSPIGLSIGAEGPEEIAVSILAEVIAVRNGVAACPSLASI
ncbi:XdhC family protein [Sporosarcina sp. FSL W7-1349]|uniref:XdhC family protein n=1 Tax=Sporosarcina sp. FSL W7-1349 TaxID=2921561 RepID=UPI0030FB606B